MSENAAGKLKMVKVEYECYTAYLNPREVSEVFPATHDREYYGISFNDPAGTRSKIVMRNGDRVYSGKEPAELVAEIEAAANA